MEIHVNGTTLWFDVDGPVLVPEGPEMRQRPTVVAIHGGPGFDHSLFKEDLWQLAEVAQVVYLDLRGHGRSGRDPGDGWSLELWADDLRALCEALGIERPVVFGHSFGSLVAAVYAARHADRIGGLLLQSTYARWDLDRVADGFRRAGGDAVADVARRYFAGEFELMGEFLTRAVPLYGPWTPGEDAMVRMILNQELLAEAPRLLDVDLTDDLGRITCPTLVGVGALDPLTQVADAHDVAACLPVHLVRLEVFEGAGHFIWKDDPDRYWEVVRGFVAEAGTAEPAGAPG